MGEPPFAQARQRVLDSPAKSALFELLGTGRAADVALLDTNGECLTYGELRETVARLGECLRSAGVREDDRVAIVLPNGLEAALIFLAVATHAVAAPLNPAYTETELSFSSEDLGATFLISPSDWSHQTTVQVTRLGLVGSGAELDLDTGTRLERSGMSQRGIGGRVPALVLHTSGTTSRPKRVPLTQANLVASAGNVARSLDLTSDDRCLNVMPLFHIHGLVASLLASLASGGSVVCTTGFDALKFRRWLDAFSPTWYTAVPTMHHVLAERVFPDLGASHSLRFVRSCSAALAPELARRVEALTGVPVVEAYGMTEAAHQIASNPVAPGTRKFGSVGVPPSGSLVVLDEQGEQLQPGVRGEFAIRGANVTDGYEDLEIAEGNGKSGGWLRTGDQGYVDEDGYVVLTGRIKELINRGGEKIAPREVDEAVERHPAVLQALAFAVPHPTLGEEVGVAVVLRPGCTATTASIRKYLAGSLANFKIPRSIVFVEELPKGPTGKLQRIGLAEKLGVPNTGH